mgnify:CR=1 FL=1
MFREPLQFLFLLTLALLISPVLTLAALGGHPLQIGVQHAAALTDQLLAFARKGKYLVRIYAENKADAMAGKDDVQAMLKAVIALVK